MSQQFQPPAPESATPVAAATPAPSGADFLAPYPAQAPAPAPQRTGNVGLGIAAALVAALAAAAAYGGIMNAIDREIGYAAVGVGAIIGFAAGKLGGRNPILPIVGALLSVASVFLGELFMYALVIADANEIGVGDVLSKVGVSGLVDVWKLEANFKTVIFLGLGAFAGYGSAKKIGD